VPVAAHEHGVSSAPVLFWAEHEQLLSTTFAREDDLLFGRILHESTSSTLSRVVFMNLLPDKLCARSVGGNFTLLRDGYKINEAEVDIPYGRYEVAWEP
jgi:hypothetical protein